MDTNPPAVLREANGSLCNAQTYGWQSGIRDRPGLQTQGKYETHAAIFDISTPSYLPCVRFPHADSQSQRGKSILQAMHVRQQKQVRAHFSLIGLIVLLTSGQEMAKGDRDMSTPTIVRRPRLWFIFSKGQMRGFKNENHSQKKDVESSREVQISGRARS
ncbi:hypothetical protein MJO28_007799 [Puccinia striiformis f. sp. tritici]|uniref:Uncharacterized protein n=1 Tax=Puccinia striiformis f. sp. tritici TaxID=168172 RepID=A0ACC0EG86_9BASI|nr:hypothetical protein MJO28_007799 [Puccinia striiformis f. sp. tritici]